MKNVLITGHLGFIGTHLQLAFEKLGVKVWGLDLRCGQDILECKLPDVDWCFHLAAQTDARTGDVIWDAQVNIMGTLRILNKYGENTVFASSSAVNYPITPYAISKMAAEHYVRRAGGRVVRLCNIYGEGGHGVINRFLEQDTLTIHGSGQQIRTYAPVEDAVAALIEAAAQEPGSLDILRGENKTVLDLAKAMDKPIVHLLPLPGDIMDGTQILCL